MQLLWKKCGTSILRLTAGVCSLLYHLICTPIFYISISLDFEEASDVILKILILYFYWQFLGIREYKLLQPKSSQFEVFKGIWLFKNKYFAKDIKMQEKYFKHATSCQCFVKI